MDAAGKPIYDPLGSSRGEVATEKSDGGIGLGAEKNPTPTLRIFASNLGNQWLMYGGIGGGTQDYTPSPLGANTAAGCKWFRFPYTGIMEIGEDSVFGNWKVTVRGEGLEPVAHQVGKHTKTTLMVGEKTSGLNPITVRSITIEPNKIKKLKGQDEEEENEYDFVATC